MLVYFFFIKRPIIGITDLQPYYYSKKTFTLFQLSIKPFKIGFSRLLFIITFAVSYKELPVDTILICY